MISRHQSLHAIPPLTTLLIIIFITHAHADDQRPDLQGVWKTSYVSMEDTRWTIVDLACSGWCPLIAYRYLEDLLADPANAIRPVKELLGEAQDYGKQQIIATLTPLAVQKLSEYNPADDPAVDCTPDGDGLRHQITAPLPIDIQQEDERVTIRYEYWNAVRTVYLDGRAHPTGEPTRLGHSIGRYEDGSLLIKTTHLSPDRISLPGGYIRSSPDVVMLERYTRRGDRLDLVWEIVDAQHLHQPYQGQKSWLLAPDWELEEFVCEAITGEY